MNLISKSKLNSAQKKVSNYEDVHSLVDEFLAMNKGKRVRVKLARLSGLPPSTFNRKLLERLFHTYELRLIIKSIQTLQKQAS